MIYGRAYNRVTKKFYQIHAETNADWKSRGYCCILAFNLILAVSADAANITQRIATVRRTCGVLFPLEFLQPAVIEI